MQILCLLFELMTSEDDHHAILGIGVEAAAATRKELKEIIEEANRKGLHHKTCSSLAGRKRPRVEIGEDAPMDS